MEAISVREETRRKWTAGAGAPLVVALLKPVQVLMAAPSMLFLAALAAMLLRHPDVPFYAIDRVAFGLLVAGVAARAIVLRQRLFVMERASWPMLGLTLLAVASVAGQPFDNETWSLLAAKFLVPFTLFHLARLVFQEERSLRQFEVFGLAVLAYLSFTAIAFLVGAKELIFSKLHSGPKPGLSRRPRTRAAAASRGQRCFAQPAGTAGMARLPARAIPRGEGLAAAGFSTSGGLGHDDAGSVAFVCRDDSGGDRAIPERGLVAGRSRPGAGGERGRAVGAVQSGPAKHDCGTL
jgi:hypothetical protein